MNLRDLAERAAWTFVEAFCSVAVLTDLSSAKAAAVAGGGAVLALLKNVAKQHLAQG